MMATVSHVTSGSGLTKFLADGYLFDRVYLWDLKFRTGRGSVPPHPCCKFQLNISKRPNSGPPQTITQST